MVDCGARGRRRESGMVADVADLGRFEAEGERWKRMEPNMIGAYGPWAAGLVGEGPARLSFRQGRFPAVGIDAWRNEARGGCASA